MLTKASVLAALMRAVEDFNLELIEVATRFKD